MIGVKEGFQMVKVNPNNAISHNAAGQLQFQVGASVYDLKQSSIVFTATYTTPTNAANNNYDADYFVRQDCFPALIRQQGYVVLDGEQIALSQDILANQIQNFCFSESKKMTPQFVLENANQQAQNIPLQILGYSANAQAGVVKTFSYNLKDFLPFFPDDYRYMNVQQQMQIVFNYLSPETRTVFCIGGGTGANLNHLVHATLTGLSCYLFLKKIQYQPPEISRYIPRFISLLYSNTAGFQQNQSIPAGQFLNKTRFLQRAYITDVNSLANTINNIPTQPLSNWNIDGNQIIFSSSVQDSIRQLNTLNGSNYGLNNGANVQLEETYTGTTMQHQVNPAAAGDDIVLSYFIIQPLQ